MDRQLREFVQQAKRVWQQVQQFYDEMYFVPYRQTMRRNIQNEEDVFKLLALSEMLGIPNPVAYYTLELLPFMLEDFHEWHVRMGMEKSPLDGFRCC
ncbi:cory-CC-star protein [Numidum massiliense]|uniref:cory-CC-star protein n=1 Tax=Numidum massiliense TaxID=1522315 RepID=UPI0006D5596B|nr:cory-CC-star protein [Numidum massiliense]